MDWDDHAQPYANLGWVWEGEGGRGGLSPTSRVIAGSESQNLTSDHTDDTDQEQGSEAVTPGLNRVSPYFPGLTWGRGNPLLQPLRCGQHLVGLGTDADIFSEICPAHGTG
jgi:hypothetical protein